MATPTAVKVSAATEASTPAPTQGEGTERAAGEVASASGPARRTGGAGATWSIQRTCRRGLGQSRTTNAAANPVATSSPPTSNDRHSNHAMSDT